MKRILVIAVGLAAIGLSALDHAAQTAPASQGLNQMRRKLVEGSLEVYPIKDYGAIEVGSHQFCHLEHGKDECGTFRFVHLWRKSDGAWKISRVVSYAH